MGTPATDTFPAFARWPAIRTAETSADCCSPVALAAPVAATHPTVVASPAPVTVNSKKLLMLVLSWRRPGSSEHRDAEARPRAVRLQLMRPSARSAKAAWRPDAAAMLLNAALPRRARSARARWALPGADDALEPLEADRFDQVVIEARIGGAVPGGILSIARERHDAHVFGQVFGLAEASGQLVAVHHRQPDVEQADVRLEGPHRVQRRRAVVRHLRFVAEIGEQLRETLAGVLVVVDDENLSLLSRRHLFRARPSIVDFHPGGGQGELHDEFASPSRPFAARFHLAPVQRHQ